MNNCKCWSTVVLAKCNSDVMFCLQSYQELRIDRSLIYYIPINDMPFELSVFLPADPESRINELRFSESISLSFKTRLGLLSNSTGNTPVYF